MTIGRAYAFFKSRCAEGGITNAIRTIKPAWKADENHPVKETATFFGVHHLADVKKGAVILRDDEQGLVPIAQEWMRKAGALEGIRKDGTCYFVKLKVPGNTNEKTAEELQGVLAAIPRVVFEGIIEKVGTDTAAIYFTQDDGSSYTCRII
jgi:hypothetical protein